jgi:hypothetical protein
LLTRQEHALGRSTAGDLRYERHVSGRVQRRQRMRELREGPATRNRVAKRSQGSDVPGIGDEYSLACGAAQHCGVEGNLIARIHRCDDRLARNIEPVEPATDGRGRARLDHRVQQVPRLVRKRRRPGRHLYRSVGRTDRRGLWRDPQDGGPQAGDDARGHQQAAPR